MKKWVVRRGGVGRGLVQHAARSVVETLEGRVFLTATGGTLSGTVYFDANNNGIRDAAETGIRGATVYLDLNKNALQDPGEPNVVVGASAPPGFIHGDFSFPNLADGAYNVRVTPPPAYSPSSPATGLLTLTLQGGSQVAGAKDFGLVLTPPTAQLVGNGVEIGNGATFTSATNNTNFGTVAVGSSKTQTFTLSNSGSRPLVLSGSPLVKVSGINAAQFKVLTQPNFNIQPGASTTFQVEYLPLVDAPGVATITFKTNDPIAASFTFAVGGTGSGFGQVVGIGGPGEQIPNAVTVDATGNSVIAGQFNGTANFNPLGAAKSVTAHTLDGSAGDDIFIAKYTTAGALSWVADIGGQHGVNSADAITTDAAGNVYVTGTFTGTVDFNPGTAVKNLTAVGVNNPYVLKLNSAGTFVWAAAFVGSAKTNFGGGKGIAVDASGNVYSTGTFNGILDFDPGTAAHKLTGTSKFDSNTDTYVSKLNSAGSWVWGDRVGLGGTIDAFSSVAPNSLGLDTSGNPVLSGNFRGTVDFDPGAATQNKTNATDLFGFVLELKTTGAFSWVKAFTDLNVSRMTLDSAGAEYVTGFFSGNAHPNPADATSIIFSEGSAQFLDKFDTNGNFQWTRVVGYTAADAANLGNTSVAVGSDGSIYLTGFFSGLHDFDPGFGVSNINGGTDVSMYVVKLSSTGDFVFADTFGTAVSQDVFPSGIAVSKTGDVYVAGTYFAAIGVNVPSGSVDFDPGPGQSILHDSTANGTDGFLLKLIAQSKV